MSTTSFAAPSATARADAAASALTLSECPGLSLSGAMLETTGIRPASSWSSTGCGAADDEAAGGGAGGGAAQLGLGPGPGVVALAVGRRGGGRSGALLALPFRLFNALITGPFSFIIN